jgi:hypothetical protein
MSTKALDRELRAANPVAAPVLAALDLGDCEADLREALIAKPMTSGADAVSVGLGGTPPFAVALRRSPPRPRRPRRLLLGLAGAAAAAAAVVVLLVGGGHDPASPAPAFGADLVRYAESTPLVLLELPGWHVQDLEQESGGNGDLRFATDSGPDKQRWLRLFWLPANQPGVNWQDLLHPKIDRTPGRRFTTRPEGLGRTVHVDTRAESAPRYGSPGDHEMSAAWKEDGRVIFLVTRVPDAHTFLERLDGLRKVDAQTWLAALPARVIKPMEYAPTVREMLKGIPLPPGFDPSRIPHHGLSQDRYQVGAVVGGTVACAWFHSWGQARAAGDTGAEARAERVLLGSETQWPIFREMAKEGAYPATVIEYARKLKSGSWYGRPVLKAVFSEDGLCGPGELGG